MCWLREGLRRQHVPASAVARPASGVPLVRHRVREGAARRAQLEQGVDTGHVLPQREGGRVPRGHRQQPTDDRHRRRRRLVRRQVSQIKSNQIYLRQE